jgi:23S rRNA pseudouridine2605 synthase
MEERIQKLLAQAGYGSRRECETYIIQGRVQVNGKTAALGEKANFDADRILLDGKPLKRPEAHVYIALNKPRMVLSTVETPDNRTTVRDLVPAAGTLYPVGRLDFESEGLILLTNDGELTNRLTHPKYGHEKEYRILVARQPDEEQLEAFRRGVVLPDGHRTAPAQVHKDGLLGKGAWLRVIVREGHKRQLRETCAIIGLPVVRLIRVRIGNLLLGSLKPREWRHLTEREVQALKNPPAARPPKPKTQPLSARRAPSDKPAIAKTASTNDRKPKARPPQAKSAATTRKPAWRPKSKA